MYVVFNGINFVRVMTFSCCVALTACDSSTTNNKQDRSGSASSSNDVLNQGALTQHDEVQHGKKLTEVAGQATLPTASEVNALDQPSEAMTPKAQQLVGRYHVQINCEDPFAMCDQGNSEFIINLLPDGTAHRTLVYMGKMTYENNDIKSNRSYQKNTWTYDEANREVIVNRIEGIQFYYKVDAHKNLIMDLDKILNGTEKNKVYFQQNNIAPTKAYVLTRFDH